MKFQLEWLHVHCFCLFIEQAMVVACNNLAVSSRFAPE